MPSSSSLVGGLPSFANRHLTRNQGFLAWRSGNASNSAKVISGLTAGSIDRFDLLNQNRCDLIIGAGIPRRGQDGLEGGGKIQTLGL